VEGSHKSIDHTFRTINFIYTISLLTDAQLLVFYLLLVGESICTSSVCLREWTVTQVRLSYTKALRRAYLSLQAIR
jgi:hypothetical protein